MAVGVAMLLIVAADGIDVAIMGFLAPSIIQEWGISRAGFGLVMSAAPWAWSLSTCSGSFIRPPGTKDRLTGICLGFRSLHSPDRFYP